jgi:hypothetical protein
MRFRKSGRCRAFVVAVCAMALAGCSCITYRHFATHAADGRRTVQPKSVVSTPPAVLRSREISPVEDAKFAEPKPATPIPLPAASLLVRQPEPSCEPTDATDERQKLDYQRQCYRHAEMIVRARLELLQGSVDRTISAVRSSGQSEP